MALIHEITGSLLLKLAGTDTSSTRSSSSSIRGQGASTGFDSDPISLGRGLLEGSSLFAASMIRLDESINDFGQAKNALSSMSEVAKEMLSIAEIAANYQTSYADRVKYQSKFKSLVLKFRDAQELAKDKDDNFLKKSDLRKQLKASGVDLNASTSLSSVFKKLGGADEELGNEKYTLANGEKIDPLKTSLSSYENATKAFEAITYLEQNVSKDLEDVEFVLDELKGARGFAFYGYKSFDERANSSLRITDPEALAKQLKGKIRQGASDPLLGAHSNIDAILAKELLNFSPKNSYL